MIGAGLTVTGLTAKQITAQTITADELASNSVTATKIAADAVTAEKIDVSQLDAIQTNTGTLTVDESITAGGSSNGIIYVKDSSNNTMVQLDNTGITVNTGKVTIKDAGETTVIDSNGLVGNTSFTSDLDSMSADQEITGDNVFADLSGLSHSIVLTRTTPVLFFGMVSWQISGTDASAMIRIKYNSSYYPHESGWGFNVYYPDAATSSHKNSFIAIINLPAGTNTIKLQAARSTTDEALYILGLNAGWRTTFGYLKLGT